MLRHLKQALDDFRQALQPRGAISKAPPGEQLRAETAGMIPATASAPPEALPVSPSVSCGAPSRPTALASLRAPGAEDEPVPDKAARPVPNGEDLRARHMKRHIAAGVLTVGIVAASLVLRSAALAIMELGQEFPVISGLFSLRYVWNPGAAFSFLADTPPGFRLPFFIGMGIIALVVVTLAYFREGCKSRGLRIGLAMVAGGAVANLVERLLAGEIIDYLDVYVGSYHRPTFNLADTTISVGVGLLLLDALWGRQTSSEAPDRKREGQP